MDFNKNSFSELEHDEMQGVEGGGLISWICCLVIHIVDPRPGF